MSSISLLLLTDSRFPAGGYAHSGGLEPAVAVGLERDELGAFLQSRLRAISRAEAFLVVAAARAARRDELDTLLELEDEAVARCPSPPMRVTASRLGAQLLRTAEQVWPSSDVVARYRAASLRTPRPVAFGVVAAAAALDDRDTARAYAYEDAATVTTAAVRLLPVDGAAAARLLVEAAAAIEQIADDAASAGDDPAGYPGAFAPLLERRSLEHAAREGRLFAS